MKRRVIILEAYREVPVTEMEQWKFYRNKSRSCIRILF